MLKALRKNPLYIALLVGGVFTWNTPVQGTLSNSGPPPLSLDRNGLNGASLELLNEGATHAEEQEEEHEENSDEAAAEGQQEQSDEEKIKQLEQYLQGKANNLAALKTKLQQKLVNGGDLSPTEVSNINTAIREVDIAMRGLENSPNLIAAAQTEIGREFGAVDQLAGVAQQVQHAESLAYGRVYDVAQTMQSPAVGAPPAFVGYTLPDGTLAPVGSTALTNHMNSVNSQLNGISTTAPSPTGPSTTGTATVGTGATPTAGPGPGPGNGGCGGGCGGGGNGNGGNGGSSSGGLGAALLAGAAVGGAVAGVIAAMGGGEDENVPLSSSNTGDTGSSQVVDLGNLTTPVRADENDPNLALLHLLANGKNPGDPTTASSGLTQAQFDLFMSQVRAQLAALPGGGPAICFEKPGVRVSCFSARAKFCWNKQEKRVPCR